MSITTSRTNITSASDVSTNSFTRDVETTTLEDSPTASMTSVMMSTQKPKDDTFIRSVVVAVLVPVLVIIMIASYYMWLRRRQRNLAIMNSKSSQRNTLLPLDDSRLNGGLSGLNTMASSAAVFTEKEKMNWLKATLAVDIAKSGLEHFLENEAKTLHGNIYHAVLSSGAVACTVCHTADLLRGTRKCPFGVCNRVHDEIVKQHRYGRPSWNNTNAQLWATNPWQIGMAFLPPTIQHLGMNSVQNTDFDLIICFMMNCNHFNNKFSFPMPCLLKKAQGISRIIRHKNKVTDSDFQDILITLTSLLTDPVCLAHDITAQEAVRKLVEIQNAAVTMTQEEMIQNAAVTMTQEEMIYVREAKDEIHKLGLQDLSYDVKETIKKDLYDGWLIALHKDVFAVLKKEPHDVKKGGNGEVALTKEKVDVFEIKLAIKRIKDRSAYETHMDALIIKETYVAKILHFGIVPLIAHHQDIENKEYYLVSPLFENGNLFDAIRHDTKEGSETLNMMTRLKIIYQIFCAMDYMHTRTHTRAPLLHLDIKSMNIVLDAKLNARLTDFGSAAEMNSGDVVYVNVLRGTPGYNPPVRLNFSRSNDYHGFGVVIRELVTGLEAVPEGQELQEMEPSEVFKRIQKSIWTDENLAKKVIDISTKCIKCLADSSDLGPIRKELSQDIRLLLRHHSVDGWSSGPKQLNEDAANNRCQLCLVNRAVWPRIHESCGFEICCACLRNSHYNPIKCPIYSCRKEINPGIGIGVGAILVAGYDKFGTFENDIRKFATVATSRVVPSMCIRTDHLHTIIPDNQLEKLESIQAKIYKALEQLVNEAKIHTLLFYYSGHGAQDHCLDITNNCHFDMNVLPEKLHQLSERNKDFAITKTIVFLDCCYPKIVEMFKGNTDQKTMIQINACGPNSQSEATRGESSFFTKCIFEALTMTANGGTCILPNCTSTCKINDDYITAERLITFIDKHSGNMNEKKPYSRVHGSAGDVYLAYNYHFKAQFEFQVHVTPFVNTPTPDSFKTKVVGVPDCLELCRVKTRLWEEYVANFAVLNKLTLLDNLLKKSEVLKTADVLCIEYKTEDDVQEIEHIDDLPRKHFLRCRLRKIEMIDINKPVAVFLKTTINIPTHYQKALTLDEVESYSETLKNDDDTRLLDALCIVTQRMKTEKLRGKSFEITCENIGLEGASIVSISVVETEVDRTGN